MLKTQFGESVTADFEENTWTFEMRGEFKVSSGVFAILPEQKYQKLLTAIKGIRNSMNFTLHFANVVLQAGKL